MILLVLSALDYKPIKRTIWRARLVDAGAAEAVPAAAVGPGAVAEALGADEDLGVPAAPPAPAAVVAADAGEDDPRHDGEPEDDGAVERVPADPALPRAQELHRRRRHPIPLDLQPQLNLLLAAGFPGRAWSVCVRDRKSVV